MNTRRPRLAVSGARLLAIAGCWAAFVITAACAPPIPAAPASPAPAAIKLRVLKLPYMSVAPIFIAQEQGLFAEQGLEVEYVSLTRSSEAIAALASGDLDVYAGSLNVGLLQAMRSENIRAVAGRGYVAPEGCPSNAILASRDFAGKVDLGDTAALKGARFGLAGRASPREYYTAAMLRSVGLDLTDFMQVEVSDEAAGQALANGAIDLWTGTEPELSRIMAEGKSVLWLDANEVTPDFHYGLVAFGPRLVEQDTEAGRRFMVAYLKALAMYDEGKTARNVDILVKGTGLDEKLVKDACWIPMTADGSYNLKSVHDFQEWAIAEGYMDEPALAGEDFWDGRFLEMAQGALDASR